MAKDTRPSPPDGLAITDRELILELAKVERGLSERAVDFVDEQAKRAERYPVGFRLSPPQRSWAADLYKQHCR